MSSRHDEVARLAYEIYLQAGGHAGRDVEHWTAAESMHSLGLAQDAPMRLTYDQGTLRIEILQTDVGHRDDEPYLRAMQQLARTIDVLPKPWNVVVDLVQVRMLSSAVLGAMVLLHRRIALDSGRMHLVNVNANLRRELHVCKLDKILTIEA